jgi:hypothetical protein
VVNGFWFGVLVGFVIGLAFTVWNDRRPYNACPRGGFHYWGEVPKKSRSIWRSTRRECVKCGVDEDELLFGKEDAGG